MLLKIHLPLVSSSNLFHVVYHKCYHYLMYCTPKINRRGYGFVWAKDFSHCLGEQIVVSNKMFLAIWIALNKSWKIIWIIEIKNVEQELSPSCFFFVVFSFYSFSKKKKRIVKKSSIWLLHHASVPDSNEFNHCRLWYFYKRWRKWCNSFMVRFHSYLKISKNYKASTRKFVIRWLYTSAYFFCWKYSRLNIEFLLFLLPYDISKAGIIATKNCPFPLYRKHL